MESKFQNPLPNYGTNQLIGTPFWENLQKIISNISEEDFVDAKIQDDEKIVEGDCKEIKSKLNKGIRKSKITFLDDKKCPEIYHDLFLMIDQYNKDISKWGYDICSFEPFQYGVYPKGGFYDWHVDSYESPIWLSSKKRTLSMQQNNFDESSKLFGNRKISLSIFLNDPDEYEGGELDIETQGPRVDPRYETFKLPKGSIVVFPSNKWHRVRPVTSGIRKSLVAWVSGPPFR
tara:strand:- start:135 stop:830 length:696 start_codon:yes stop_codon:yes gene_type:complete